MQNSKRPLSSSSNSNESKKIKKIDTQTNTLLNYFGSTKSKLNEPKTQPQNTILNYFKSEENGKETKENLNDTKPKVLSVNDCNLDSSKKNFAQVSSESKIKTNTIVINNHEIEINSKYEPENEYAEPVAEVNTNRKCPFYRRVEGTNLVVDAFRYGNIENCSNYFLSHFHYDHYIGLNKKFTNTMYCSYKTANLVAKQIRVDRKYLRPLDLNSFVNVDGDESVQVALIDANQ